MRVLMAHSTAESPINGRNPSIRSSASARPAESRLMIEADVGIEPHRVTNHREIPSEQAVGERQQRVDRILRRPPIAVTKIEDRGVFTLVHLDHAGELLEVHTRRGALDTEQRLEAVGA